VIEGSTTVGWAVAVFGTAREVAGETQMKSGGRFVFFLNDSNAGRREVSPS
jgi:hypothetical protein